MINLFQLYLLDIHVHLYERQTMIHLYNIYDTYIYPACLAAKACVVLSDAFLRRSFPAIRSGYIPINLISHGSVHSLKT
jgi:hypothetical protein